MADVIISGTPLVTTARFTPWCGLCHAKLVLGEANHIVTIITRQEPKHVQLEVWCEGCSTLYKGVEWYRHLHLPKECH